MNLIMTKTSRSILFTLLLVLVFSPIIGTAHADTVTVTITPVFNDAGVPISITIDPNPHILKDGDSLKWNIADTKCPPDSHSGTTTIITPPGSPFGQVAPNPIVGGVIAFAPKDIEWPHDVTSYTYSVTFACSPEITFIVEVQKDMNIIDNNSIYLMLIVISVIAIFLIYLRKHEMK